MKLKYCGLAAMIAVAALLIFSGMYFSQVSASYTPTNPVIAHWDSATDIPKNVSVVGWTHAKNTAYFTGVYLVAAAQDDDVRWAVSFPDTSPRTLYVRGSTGNNQGTVTVQIDGVNQSTFDQYSAPALNNQILTASITPARSGMNVLRFWVSLNNPSSSGDYITISEWWII